MGCAGESAQPIIIMYGGRGLADEGFAAGDGLLVEGDEVVVTLGQGFAQCLHDAFSADDGVKFEIPSENEHIEALHHGHFGCCLHGGHLP